MHFIRISSINIAFFRLKLLNDSVLFIINMGQKLIVKQRLIRVHDASKIDRNHPNDD